MAGRQPTVLVVDDDPAVRQTVHAILGEEGFNVITAEDGAQALERVAEEMPSAILLDMRMPHVDGWAFARAFRDRYDRQAPLIVMTAATDASRWAQEIGAEACLPKPFELEDPLSMVGRLAPTP